VVQFWNRDNKGECEMIMELERGVALREHPEHKKLVWRDSFEERKLIVNVLGNGLPSERFTFVMDFENVWDLVRYEGRKKVREIL